MRDVGGRSRLHRRDRPPAHQAVLRAVRHTPCIFEYVYFARPTRSSTTSRCTRRAAHGRTAGGQESAARAEPRHRRRDPIPTPAARARCRWRRSWAEVREGFIKNRYIGRTFIMPEQGQRKKSVRNKLNAIDLEFRGRNVLLVDDSDRARHDSARSSRSRARRAPTRCISHRPRRRCVSRTSTHRHRGLRTRRGGPHEDEVARLIGADWLIYQDLDDLVKPCAITIRREPVRHVVLFGRVRHRRHHAGVPRPAAARAFRSRQADAQHRHGRFGVLKAVV